MSRWNQRYDVIVADHIADWDAINEWERARFTSMEDRLEPGMVLFDVGTEWGALSAIYAQFVGGTNMVLFEPEPRFWPTIRETWQNNQLGRPAGCWPGFVSDQVTAGAPARPRDIGADGWPLLAWDTAATTARAYRYLHSDVDAAAIPAITLDAYAVGQSIVPDAVTIDVEGAEIRVLAGGSWLLRTVRPLVWCSIHPDLIERDGYGTDADVHDLMASLDYRGTHLGTDHEQHWLFEPA